MNYATVINGPFSGNANNSRLGHVPNGHDQQMELTRHHLLMATHGQQFNGCVGQPTNIYNQFGPAPTRDSRVNIHIGSKLFVGQVPAMATEEQLRPVFEPYGNLLEVKIMRDSLGRSKGSAWVRYETNEMAMAAINALHEKHTVPPQTNPLRVQFATPNTGRHYHYQQQQNQQQRQAGYPAELGDSISQYKIGVLRSNALQKTEGMMMQQGALPNVIPRTNTSTCSSGSRFVPLGFSGRGSGSSMETAPIASEPYTFSANCFSNTNVSGNRRNKYQPFEQQQTTSQQLYPQQKGGHPSFFSSQQSMGNQPSSYMTINRGANNVKTGVGIGVDSFDAGYCGSNPNGSISKSIISILPTE